MADAETTIALVGLGGYGQVYLESLLDNPQRDGWRIVAAFDPEPERCSYLARLNALQVPILDSSDEFYAAIEADLVVVSSPIQMHCEQTCAALERGAAVLCEKPAAAVVQDVDRMIAARNACGGIVAIGFQWSFSRGIRDLKRDILSGLFGAPRRFRSLTLWPRDESYYRRNNWAGRLRDDAGRWVLDSPANNAMAHDLHNMLFVLGDEPAGSAVPASVTAETYCANQIETFDTVAARVITKGGVEILFIASHATSEVANPVFSGEFENATVEYAGDDSPIIARCADGSVREYPSPQADPQTAKLWCCVDALREGAEIPCGLEAARSHTLCVNGIHESSPRAGRFPDPMIERSGAAGRVLTHVPGLAEALRRCYAQAELPSESGHPWAEANESVSLDDYREFPRSGPER
ncbi:MAG: Gfo/Idh/MocA family oxidoreductase [Phycisphaerales bacterium]|nr:MAG: Gfo/Idh/MocA family oxidoreductase [Phycisphaerales bacterium]